MRFNYIVTITQEFPRENMLQNGQEFSFYIVEFLFYGRIDAYQMKRLKTFVWILISTCYQVNQI